jgi:hypothetical protein
MSSNAGPRSEDDFIRWCDTCDSPWRDCRTPKEHERKSKKIVKEKASRERQAQVLQKLEDLLENNSDMTPLKLQMPGNQKKSGLLYDKQQVIEAVLIKADMDTRMLASLLGQDEFDRYCDRVSRAQLVGFGVWSGGAVCACVARIELRHHHRLSQGEAYKELQRQPGNGVWYCYRHHYSHSCCCYYPAGALYSPWVYSEEKE